MEEMLELLGVLGIAVEALQFSLLCVGSRSFSCFKASLRERTRKMKLMNEWSDKLI